MGFKQLCFEVKILVRDRRASVREEGQHGEKPRTKSFLHRLALARADDAQLELVHELREVVPVLGCEGRLERLLQLAEVCQEAFGPGPLGRELVHLVRDLVHHLLALVDQADQVFGGLLQVLLLVAQARLLLRLVLTISLRLRVGGRLRRALGALLLLLRFGGSRCPGSGCACGTRSLGLKDPSSRLAPWRRPQCRAP